METVTVLTAGTVTDPYSGEAAEDWATPTEREVVTVVPPEPLNSAEPTQDARNSVEWGYRLFLPAGDPITRLDRVEVRGEAFPVRGAPKDWGVGVEVLAFRTEG